MKRLGLAVTAAAAGFAVLCFVAGYPTVIYDSWGYYYLSGVLRTGGLLAWPTDTRTYGYPLFLAAVTGFRDLPPEEFRLVVFLVQLALYLGTCAFVARRLADVFRSPEIGACAYACAASNPVLLLHTTEPLSDLISAILISLSVALSWKRPGESLDERSRAWRPFLSFFFAGAAVAVRPANAAVAAAVALVWGLRAARWRDLRPASIAAALAGLVPPLIPQLILNVRVFGRVTPLLVKDLYRLQTQWGMAALKYATLVIPGRSPFLVYTNPLYRGDPNPVSFLLHHPLRYLATLALHAFAMIDADLPYTYVTDLDPWYRWPLDLANFLLLYLALVGVVVGARRLTRRSFDEVDFVFSSTVFVAAAYALPYLPVEVESRFGLPLEMLMTPLVAVGLIALVRPGVMKPLGRRLALAGAPAFLLAAAALSAWIAAQRTNPIIPSPANAPVLDPPRAHATMPARPTPRPSP